ncbi:3349_t:CDS:1, partial [Gigaspora margarita]
QNIDICEMQENAIEPKDLEGIAYNILIDNTDNKDVQIDINLSDHIDNSIDKSYTNLIVTEIVGLCEKGN